MAIQRELKDCEQVVVSASVIGRYVHKHGEPENHGSLGDKDVQLVASDIVTPSYIYYNIFTSSSLLQTRCMK